MTEEKKTIEVLCYRWDGIQVSKYSLSYPIPETLQSSTWCKIPYRVKVTINQHVDGKLAPVDGGDIAYPGDEPEKFVDLMWEKLRLSGYCSTPEDALFAADVALSAKLHAASAVVVQTRDELTVLRSYAKAQASGEEPRPVNWRC